jgi:site-specific DNA recombinase
MSIEKGQKEIKYFMYCRRSSDTEDKQVQSIDAQKRELGDFAKQNGLNVIEIFEESQSAKAPGRPIFIKMIERINNGEAGGLLVWKLNRLARNPIDGGTINWMLQQKIIKHIQTYGRSYYPEDNVIVMAVEFGMANQFVRDLSIDTKRGLRERIERGYPSGVAPIGFLNDLSSEPGKRNWIVDIDRFNLVRQMLEAFLTGSYSIRKLTDFANNELGLRTTIHRKQGGKKLVISHVSDTILKNPVYAGFFFTNDSVRHELNKDIPRMISEDKYWEIQRILGSRGRPRPSKNPTLFPYIGPIKCDGCGGSVTAEHKYQLICPKCKFKFSYLNKEECPKCHFLIEDMVDPVRLHYIYYHCTKKKDPNCKEGSVQELFIDDYLSSYYKKNLEISKSLSNWCLENLEQLGTLDKQDNKEKTSSLEKTIFQKENELKELVLMKTKKLLDDDEFISSKMSVKEEIKALQGKLQKLNQLSPERQNKGHRAFDLAVGVSEVFKNGSKKDKKDTLLEIGSNLTLKEKKLSIYNTNLYSIIINGLTKAKTKNTQFEPENIVDTSSQNEVFEDVRSTLLRR